MEKPFKYYIFEDKKLIVEILSGGFDQALERYLDLKKREIMDPKYNPNFSFIVDLRDLKINEIRDFKTVVNSYIKYASKIPHMIGKRKSALLTNSPKQVVITTLYKSLSNLPIELEIFSTLKSALSWLNVDHIDPGIFEV